MEADSVEEAEPEPPEPPLQIRVPPKVVLPPGEPLLSPDAPPEPPVPTLVEYEEVSAAMYFLA